MASKDRQPDAAVTLLADNMMQLEHPDTHHVLKLVQFQGNGAKALRIQIAEAIIALLRSEGHMPASKPKKAR